MRKLIVLVVLLLTVFVVYNRHRLYVRDPLARVTRAAAPEAGAQVFINYDNDVLLENDNAPRYIEVVQHGNHAGVPDSITCIHWAACLLDADQATLVPDLGLHVEGMSNKVVQFQDSRGDAVVTLR